MNSILGSVVPLAMFKWESEQLSDNLLIKTIFLQIIVMDNCFANYWSHQLFFADFCSGQIWHPFVPKKNFCNNLFLPGGLGQGCPGGPGLRGLNEQTI